MPKFASEFCRNAAPAASSAASSWSVGLPADSRAAAITVLLKHGADASIHTRVESVREATAREQAATKKRNEVLISFEPEKHKGDSALIAAQRDSAAAQAGFAVGGAGGAGGGGGGGFGGGRRGGGGPQPKGPFTPDQIQAAIDSGRAVLLSQPGIEYRRHAASVSSTQAEDGSRFAEERAYFTEIAAVLAARGWTGAARAAQRLPLFA